MKRYSRFLTLYLICALILSGIVPAKATEETTPYPIITTSNSIEGWPAGPEIFSGSAVVMEAETGTVLYDKNMHQQAYPASITKILTAILAIENCSMNEMVEFSHDAVFSVPRDSSHIAIVPGELLTMENCLYGLMLASANEVANAIAEHVSGNIDNFVTLMNQRAKELGAINTHFNNTNGLPDEAHYTSCYDMAMISRAAVSNETFIKIDSTTSYMIPPTNLQVEERPVNSLHPLLINGSKHYDGCFGGKTGYTTIAGNTLVTFARRDGITLICVVMQSDAVNIYDDSTALLNYGFENFSKYNIAENETKFNLQGSGFFESANSIFESSYPQIGLNADGFIMLPSGASFSEAEPTVEFRNNSEKETDADVMADITYAWHGHYVGRTTLDVTSTAQNEFSFTSNTNVREAETGTSTILSDGREKETESSGEKKYLTINVWHMLAGILGVSVLIGLCYLYSITRQQRERWKRIHRQKRRLRSIERKRRKRKYYPTRKLR